MVTGVQTCALPISDGNSINPVWPSLAGQHEEYTARQLSLFKSGERKNAVMAGMVAGLNTEDMQNLGAYLPVKKPNLPQLMKT